MRLGRPDKLAARARGRRATPTSASRRGAPVARQRTDGYARLNVGIADAASPEGVAGLPRLGRVPHAGRHRRRGDGGLAASTPRPGDPGRAPAHPQRPRPCAPPATHRPCRPLFVAAPARKSKSVPMLTVIAAVALLIPEGQGGRCQRRPQQDRAPRRAHQQGREDGVDRGGHRAASRPPSARQLGRNGTDPADDHPQDFRAANLFSYSHDGGDHDINAFDRVGRTHKPSPLGPRRHLGPRRGRHPRQEAARPRRAADGQGARDPAAAARTSR